MPKSQLDKLREEELLEQKLLKMPGIDGDIARCREYVINFPSPNHSNEFKLKIAALESLFLIEKAVKEFKSTISKLEKENASLKKALSKTLDKA